MNVGETGVLDVPHHGRARVPELTLCLDCQIGAVHEQCSDHRDRVRVPDSKVSGLSCCAPQGRSLALDSLRPYF